MRVILLSSILLVLFFIVNSCYVGYGEPCFGEDRGEFLLKDADVIPEIENLVYERTQKNGAVDTISFYLEKMDTAINLVFYQDILSDETYSCQNYVESRQYHYKCDSSFDFKMLFNAHEAPPFEIVINYNKNWGHKGKGISWFEYRDYYGKRFQWKAFNDECEVLFRSDSGMVEFYHKTDSISLKRIK